MILDLTMCEPPTISEFRQEHGLDRVYIGFNTVTFSIKFTRPQAVALGKFLSDFLSTEEKDAAK